MIAWTAGGQREGEGSQADNLLLVGLAMILFGAALIALLTVTNKMLRRAAEAESKGAAQ